MSKYTSLIKKAVKAVSTARVEEAYSIFEELLHADLEEVNDIVNFAHMCMEFGEGAQAIENYTRALIKEPDNPLYLANLGRAYMYDQRYTEAEILLNKAIEIDPKQHEALLYLGILQSFGNIAVAINTVEQSLQLNPNSGFANNEMALLLSRVGRYEEALKYSDKALQLEPKNALFHESRGSIFSELGKVDQAEASYKNSIKLDRTMGTSYRSLAAIRKYTSKDKAFIEKMENMLKEGMPAIRRSHMHSALGKIYDDCGEWDKAFEHYRKANILESPAGVTKLPYKMFKTLSKFFTREMLERTDIYRSDSRKPVFIVGMPRSGTTLIETIISSHHDAVAGGELQEMDYISRKMCSTDNADFVSSRCNEMLTDEGIRASADEYLSVLNAISESAGRVVDKMPGNFFMLGLIHLMFPNATIIHARRNLLDTCLSCYFQPFRDVKWALDLDEIAEQYIFYRTIMDYWMKVLPEGKIVDVHYENVIEHPEEESRRLIDACGLEWDPACLEFNKSDRSVGTASLWQVRQPIYKTSKMRSRHYAKHLSGLANKLQKYLPDDPELRKEFGIKKKFLGIF